MHVSIYKLDMYINCTNLAIYISYWRIVSVCTGRMEASSLKDGLMLVMSTLLNVCVNNER